MAESSSKNLPMNHRNDPHSQDIPTSTGPSITESSPEDTSDASTPPTWLASLPLPSPPLGVSKRSEQQVLPAQSTLNAEEICYSEEDPAVEEPEYSGNAEDGEGAHNKSTADSDEVDPPESTAELIARADEQMDILEITFALTNATMHFGQLEDVEAEDCAQHGLNLAKELGEEAGIARCNYYLGCIEYIRGNAAIAHRLFRDARPCIGEYPEGHDVPAFLSVFQRGVAEEDRHQILRSHFIGSRKESRGSQIIPNNVGAYTESPEPPSPNLPPATVDQPELMTKCRGCARNVTEITRTSSSMEEHHTPEPLLKGNTDTHPGDREDSRRFSDPTATDRKGEPASMAGTKASSFKPQRGFSFTLYPKGLAPRNRITRIFSEQYWEWNMSRTEWENIKEAWRERSVTMEYLASERSAAVDKAVQREIVRDLGSVD